MSINEYSLSELIGGGRRRAKIQKTKIDWCDYTWNCASGCLNNCPYCYARKIALRFPSVYPNGFEPTFYPARYSKSLPKKPSIIFVNSMFDIFTDSSYKYYPDLPPHTIATQHVIGLIFDKAKKNKQHFFLALSKLPFPYWFNIPKPKNFWIGYSLTKESEDIDRTDLRKFDFISAEPLDIDLLFKRLKEIIKPRPNIVQHKRWVIIGCQTNPIVIDTDRKAILKLYEQLKKADIPLFIKNPLREKLDVDITEYPREILNHLKRR